MRARAGTWYYGGMIKRSGYADLPLHQGTVPRWLADRMRDLGTEIVETLILEFGRREVLRRLSDPLWFQSLGAALGMDWHSSGITTSVMYALKRGLNARARELGIVICGGRGKYSRRTPEELLFLAEHTGLDGDSLVRSSKLAAKIDNTAVQDGFQLYQHNFILSKEGDWAVVQQGMNSLTRTARRYHWCSADLPSFVEQPHTGITGESRGLILNLTDSGAGATRSSIVALAREQPSRILQEVGVMARTGAQLDLFAAPPAASDDLPFVTEDSRNCRLPQHHDVRAEDVDTKRLGAVLATAYESQPADFESLLLTPGLGPRTVQSLTLVSELIYGTPSRFTDPARYSFAHGGKDGHPFPVPTRVYDETIRILGDSIEKSRLGYKDKSDCLRRLHQTALQIEQHCAPEADFDAALAHEKAHSREWGGRTCMGWA